MEFVIFTFRACVSSLGISRDIVEGDIILSHRVNVPCCFFLKIFHIYKENRTF